MNNRSIDLYQILPHWGVLFLEMMSNIRKGSVTIVTPEEKFLKYTGIEEGEHVSIRINEWKFCEDIFMKGDIGLGESYISGYWDCGNINNLIKFGIENYNELERVIKGSLLKILFFRIKHFLNRNSRKGSLKNVHAHYDIGNEFYQLWLDSSMTYSSAIFNSTDEELLSAQENKYERILKKLKLKNGDHILEVGCGWGGFMEYAARNGFKVTGVTISKEQYEFAKKRLSKFGNLAKVKLQDYRDIDGKYNHIVSIEMFEALGEKYWKKYFKMLFSILKPGGKLIIQSITINNNDFFSYRKCSDFIQQYIFPGGMLPSPKIFKDVAVKQGFIYRGDLEFGRDYGITLKRWEENFSSVLSRVKKLGFDDKFIRTWRFYLKYCQGGFEANKISVFQFSFTK
ncbi:SAM-dependent methyltransferase [Zunongwangia profunda]|uniref:SAM-dependent methyltransferase n=1 Tax=Zunongwangia profunda TaxID=398743 RepID=UPI000C95F57D|nr:cyclopropane-fatty-acyl-phospholipid synthase family protein [Zunongwangia profunda]MAM26788.1 SAM-dependent methyltransferase [Chloroflexota bacterium]|tara:strand:- start:80 stop:1273 length:1194 start_codon:yes stop_codon:yes gene_type:complete